MDVQPPLLALIEQEDEGELSLEDQFAQILHALMKDDISAATAIQAFENASVAMMQQYRDASSALLHRAAHYLHTRRLAADLDAQAASWQLLQSLYCSGDKPAGVALAGAADAGGQQTLRQLTADLVNSNRQLRRLAQVVSWLESLAAQQLQGAPQARFAHHEGLWRETLLTTASVGSRGAGRGGEAVELDPDAPSRGKVTLASGDRKGEERLAAQLWQLVRAGKLREARRLCCQAGQAWRCLSLAGGGEWGPLPVGAAAAEAAEQIDQQAAADELACQVEGGVASGRLAWKWACYAAAEAAANATPGNRWEAAVYGALCGHVMAMLPVCASWEDELWSYCRAWLDLQTDAMLLEGVEQQLPGAVQEMLGASGEDDAVSPELLACCVSQAAASGYSSSTDISLLHDGLAVMSGGWPLDRLLSQAERSLVPRTFGELMQLVSNSTNAAVRQASKQQQHVLQLLLMSEDWGSITLELAGAALAAAEQLQQLQQQQQAAQGQQQQPDGDGDADEQMEDDGTLSGVEDEGARMSAESASGVLRFTAHVALCLRALGLMPDHNWSADEDEEAEWGRLQTMMGKVVHQYALHLAQQPETLHLVPLYLCHLRLGLREALTETLLDSATDTLNDESCQALYLQLFSATEEWRERQQRLDALVLEHGKAPGPYWDVEEVEEAGEEQGMMGLAGSGLRLRQPSSCLFGDLRPEELRLLLRHLVSRGFASSSTSPLQRCRQLRWLFYTFTCALAQQQHTAQLAGAADPTDPAAAAATDAGDAGPAAAAALIDRGDLAWQDIWGDALGYALGLASEMLLNPGFGSAGLQALLGQVVPAAFLEVVSRVAAEQLAEPAQQLQVQRQLLALQFWQRYAAVDGSYQQWKEDWAAALAAGDGAGGAVLLGDVAEQGQQLAGDMLALALEDCLTLQAPAELVQILLARQEDGAAGVAVEEGEHLGLPRFDDADEKPAELVMALTVAREGAQGSDPEMPFLQLEARDADVLMQQLSLYLARATAATQDVSFEVALADPEEDLAGSVLVRLTSFTDVADPSAPSEEAARLGRRMTKSWQDMVAVAARMMGSSNSAAGVGSGEAAVELPRLSLVHMFASCSTQLALSRRRTTSKLLQRSGKVLLNLARAGHPSSQLDVLISAAGDAAGRDGPALLELLSPSDSAKLLVLLEQAIEEGGLQEEEEGVELEAGRQL